MFFWKGTTVGTKNNPGAYDCWAKAAVDEPLFVLLARDASAPALVEFWAAEREKHGEEAGVVAEARECAESMRAWRDHNRPPVELPLRIQCGICDRTVDMPVKDGRADVSAATGWEFPDVRCPDCANA